MVAVDEDGKPRLIPPLIVESEEERRDFRRAEIRREHRLALREAMT
jgi:acyl-CoA hydrolase